MRINNNPQTTSFKANTIVRFKEPALRNMTGLASVFAEMEGHIPHGHVGKPFLLDDGKSVLVPDISTSLGKMFNCVSKYMHELASKTDLHTNTEARRLFEDTASIIEHDNSTVKIPYKDPFKE